MSNIITMQELISAIKLIYPISLELTEHLLKVVNRKAYQKGELLLKAGQVSMRTNYVESGLLRSFIVEDDKDYTTNFFTEGEVSILLASVESQTPSTQSVEAMEDSSIIYLEYKDLQFIFANYPEANNIAIILLAKAQKRYKEQLDLMKKLNAAEKYEWFIKQFPKLVQRVPGKYIASYLGMTEFTLSRIRGAYNG